MPFWLRLVATGLSALAIGLAFPPASVKWLAWIGLTPLLVGLRGAGLSRPRLRRPCSSSRSQTTRAIPRVLNAGDAELIVGGPRRQGTADELRHLNSVFLIDPAGAA